MRPTNGYPYEVPDHCAFRGVSVSRTAINRTTHVIVTYVIVCIYTALEGCCVTHYYDATHFTDPPTLRLTGRLDN